jgi:hypothetical protein
MSEKLDNLFAVFAESEEHDRPLIQVGLTFARLMDDIVVPYQSGEPFFIDGAPMTVKKLKRIKILCLSHTYDNANDIFNSTLTHGRVDYRKIYGEQYATRFDHMLRENTEDVTSQVIKAYGQAIKPKLKDYLTNREELIGTALKIFILSVNALNGIG